MGREIRRVPPNWEHPRYDELTVDRGCDPGDYRPCYDADYETAARKWLENCALWCAGKHPHQSDLCRYYWEFERPPAESTCRPAFEVEPVWYQVYETQSEGTPVSPAFRTPEELATYLSTQGDFWYQAAVAEGQDTFQKPTYAEALAMIQRGWAASMALLDGELLGPYQQEKL